MGSLGFRYLSTRSEDRSVARHHKFGKFATRRPEMARARTWPWRGRRGYLGASDLEISDASAFRAPISPQNRIFLGAARGFRGFMPKLRHPPFRFLWVVSLKYCFGIFGLSSQPCVKIVQGPSKSVRSLLAWSAFDLASCFVIRTNHKRVPKKACADL